MNDDKNDIQKDINTINRILEKNILLSIEDSYEFDEKQLDIVPDKVKYSKVEKFIKDNSDRFPDVEITRRIFTSYIQNGILPPIMDENQPNDKMNYYTKEQILYYIMAQQLKSVVKLDDLSRLFGQLRDLDEEDNSVEIFKLYVEMYEVYKSMMKSTVKELIEKIIMPDLLDENKECTDEMPNETRVLMKFSLLISCKAIIDMYDEI